MIRMILALLFTSFLSACGGAAHDPLVKAIGSVAAHVTERPAAPKSIAEQTANVLEDVAKSDVDGPVLLVVLESLNRVASLVPIAQNAEAVTWLDQTGVSIVTRRGVVVSTRGLGHDLMASDVSGTLNALSDDAAEYQIVRRYLNGEGVLGRQVLDCKATRHIGGISERCSGNGISNDFALRGDEVWMSRQWIGAEIGYARLRRLQ